MISVTQLDGPMAEQMAKENVDLEVRINEMFQFRQSTVVIENNRRKFQ